LKANLCLELFEGASRPIRSSPPATAAPPTLFLVGLGIAILAALQARRRFLLR